MTSSSLPFDGCWWESGRFPWDRCSRRSVTTEACVYTRLEALLVSGFLRCDWGSRTRVCSTRLLIKHDLIKVLSTTSVFYRVQARWISLRSKDRLTEPLANYSTLANRDAEQSLNLRCNFDNGRETCSHIGLKEAPLSFLSLASLIPDLCAHKSTPPPTPPPRPQHNSLIPHHVVPFTLQPLQLNCVFKVQVGTWKECSACIKIMERKIMIQKNTHAHLINRSTVSSCIIINVFFYTAGSLSHRLPCSLPPAGLVQPAPWMRAHIPAARGGAHLPAAHCRAGQRKLRGSVFRHKFTCHVALCDAVVTFFFFNS